jgi:hypothetical protein
VSGFSPAASQKNGRSNRKRNSKKANDEGRRKEFFLFYYDLLNTLSACGGELHLLKKEQSEATSTIRSAEGGFSHFLDSRLRGNDNKSINIKKIT